jgi:hypothetical protein
MRHKGIGPQKVFLKWFPMKVFLEKRKKRKEGVLEMIFSAGVVVPEPLVSLNFIFCSFSTSQQSLTLPKARQTLWQSRKTQATRWSPIFGGCRRLFSSQKCGNCGHVPAPSLQV